MREEEVSTLLDFEVIQELEEIGTKDMMFSLVELFNSTIEETLGRMEESQGGADLDGFAEAIHKLKGSSGSIGAAQLYKSCQEIDHLAKTGRLTADSLGMHLETVRKEVRLALDALQAYLSGES